MSLFGNVSAAPVDQQSWLINNEMATIVNDFGHIWRGLIETRKGSLDDSGLYYDILAAPLMASRYWINRVNRDGFGPAPEFITTEISSYIQEALLLTLLHNGVSQPKLVYDKLSSCLEGSLRQMFDNSPTWLDNRRMVIELALLLSLNLPSASDEGENNEQ
jgi:hypothetical protein